MSVALLLVMLAQTGVVALSVRRGHSDRAMRWRGMRTLTLGLLLLWSTFALDPALRIAGGVAVVLCGVVGAVQLVIVRRARRLDSAP